MKKIISTFLILAAITGAYMTFNTGSCTNCGGPSCTTNMCPCGCNK
jgi:hypothetical protein